MLYQAQHAAALGLRIPHAEADWALLQARVRQVQERIRGGTPDQARAAIAAQGIDLFMGEAMFRSPHALHVNGATLRGEQFVLATGLVPFIPDIEGLSEAGYITNVEAVALPELPQRLVVIGGGPIGLEFAQLFSRFGVQVVVLERGPQPLPHEDPELARALCAQLTAEGIRLVFGAEMQCADELDHPRDGFVERGAVPLLDLCADLRPQPQREAALAEDLVVDQLLVAEDDWSGRVRGAQLAQLVSPYEPVSAGWCTADTSSTDIQGDSGLWLTRLLQRLRGMRAPLLSLSIIPAAGFKKCLSCVRCRIISRGPKGYVRHGRRGSANACKSSL